MNIPTHLVLQAFELAPDPALVLDGARRTVLGANRRARTILGEREAFADYLPGGTHDPLLLLPAGTPMRVELRGAGTVHGFEGTFTPLSTEPQPDTWLLTLRPLVRDSATKLARIRRMELMGEMARGVARDFKNVMQAIALAREELAQYEPDSDLLRRIGDALALGGDLLASWHALALDGHRRHRNICISDAVRRAETVIRSLSRSVPEVLFEVPAEPVWVEGDEGQVVQLLMNLAMRARDAIGRDGTRLHVRLRADGDQVELAVSDDGQGMPREQRELLFEEGAQGAGREGGVLASVGHVVAALGGQLSVTSPVLGTRGTEMRVVLVRAAGPDRSGSYLVPPKEPEALLLGRDPSVRGLLESAMEVLGLSLCTREPDDLYRDRVRVSDALTALCFVDLDEVASSAFRVELLARVLAFHERTGVPLLLIGGPLEGELRAQVSLLRARGARLLRKPLGIGAVLRGAATALQSPGGAPDAARARFHEAS